MNKLEVGMYIRTDKGFIAKVKEFKHDYTKGKRLVDDYSVKEVVENYLSLDGNQCRLIESIDYSIPPCYPSDEELDEIKSHILKASHNVIDLIEVGDYVNGYYVSKIWKIGEITHYVDEKPIQRKDRQITIQAPSYGGIIHLHNEQIKSIVTKEQFSSMEYRLGG